MSAEASYFRLGLFVLLGLALALSCAVVLGGGQLFSEMIRAETYFDESVQGLSVGSPLMVRGVQLGQVEQIDFVDRVYELGTQAERDKFGQWIYVRMQVTPIEREELELSPRQGEQYLSSWIQDGFRLRLATNPISGVSFVQGDFVDPEAHPPLQFPWEPEHLFVPSAPSALSTIATAAERIFRRLEKAEIESVVENLNTFLSTLNDKVAALDVEGFQGEGKRLLAEMRLAIREANVGGLSVEARQTLEDVDAAVVRVQRLLEGSRYDFQVTLENLRVSTENLRELSETATKFPSFMILGDEPPPSREIEN